MKHARVSGAGPLCSSVRRRGEGLSILNFGLGQGPGQYNAAATQFGSQDQQVDGALQIALKRGYNMFNIGRAFDVACQMKDDLRIRLAADFSNLSQIREVSLPPLWTLDVSWPFRPVDGVYLRAPPKQTAAQMGANESIGAGDENLLSPE
jgi:hypothetical protein